MKKTNNGRLRTTWFDQKNKKLSFFQKPKKIKKFSIYTEQTNFPKDFLTNL